MVSNNAKEVLIQGITLDGRTFRPSDWAERLAGVMGQFRPGGATPGSHLSYSPWCIPQTLGASSVWWFTPTCVAMSPWHGTF